MDDFRDKNEMLFHKMRTSEFERLLYRNMIVEENLKLVSVVLRKYRPYTDDDFQCGCLGLIQAVDLFDERKNVAFSSWACFCIERALHIQHKRAEKSIERMLADQMVYLDSIPNHGTDDRDMSEGDKVASITSEEEFNEALDRHMLVDFFNDVVYPCLNTVISRGRYQASVTKIDWDVWKTLEVRYLLELADNESQKVRLTFSRMATVLGVSVPNLRNRHLSLVGEIRKEMRKRGYKVND